ncbi:class I SAM-dependent RNA methyltransferase, partial [bacterium]|nr:class I SAM-dependent RNA methyltransferase [bacterium]
AQENAKLNKIKNAHFLVGKAEEIFLQESQKKDFQADLVVLNPPRKGCEKVLLEVLTKVKPRKIIYVSCDPATLARDLKILCQDYYTLTHVQPVDMFPQTVHVETVACLTLV